jgi:2-polyprenyl-6-methoxyphenol hydroxylase-like FAD-dependent oxidoreductase
MPQPTALISGAGVAGPTLAHWLARGGYAVTVVERAKDLRSSGAPVDVRGDAWDVVERMGLLPALRAASTVAGHLRIVDSTGRSIARVPLDGVQGADGRWVEVPRGDLAALLTRAAQDDAEFVFGDGVVALDQDANGVDVTFERAGPRRFDVVVGADGLHSAVRRLAFGPDEDVLRHMGLYIATVFFDDDPDPAGDAVLYNTPGRALAVHPGTGRPGAALMFRSPPVPGFDHRDTAQHKRLVTAAFSGGGWRTPEVLDRVHETDDLYFDAAAAVRLPTWTSGRIGLLGDASAAASFLGDGSSLAIVGAATLAEELTADPADPAAALRRYEARHRRRTDPVQRQADLGSRLLIPATASGIAVRNTGARVFAAGAAARRLVGRRIPATSPTHTA